MSQIDFMRQIDGDMVAAFRAAGMADTATYTAPGGAAIACSVMIDSSSESLGDFGPVDARTRIISLFKVDVPSPVRNARIVVGPDAYILSAPLSDDGSRAMWAARYE